MHAGTAALIRHYGGAAIAVAALAYATVISGLFVSGALPRHRAESAWFIAAALALVVAAATAWRLSTPSAVTASPGRRESFMLAGLLVAASGALYFPILSTGLVSDDFVLINRAASGLVTMGTGLFRPLPMIIWGATSRFAGVESPLFHVINVTAHGLNAWMVARLAAELGVSRGWALMASVLFLASPSSVESVAWVSALFDVLMVSGVLTYVLACLLERRALAIGALLVALLSKETGIVAGVLGLGLAAVRGRPLRLPWAGVAIAAVFTAVRVLALPPPDAYFAPPTRYVVKELLSRSFGALGLPWTASDITAHPMLALFPWLALAVLSILAIVVRLPRERFLCIAALLAWIVVSVLPVYHYFFVAPTLEGSRYLYLGTAAFVLLLAQLASVAPEGTARRVAAATLLASIVTGAAGVVLHQRAWVVAAAQRDAVLEAARLTLAKSPCDAIAVTDLPDAFEGAYIFRNGFREALDLSGIATPPIRDQAPCAYRWTGRDFTR